jgi:NADH-quinone oxidoreductase subunit J
MNLSAVIFYAIAAFILVTAALAVSSGKIFRSAIWLLSALVGIAGFYFWIGAEFIAAVQIVVYVGGIVVLIIFSIFLTHDSGKELPAPLLKRKIFSILAALFGFGFSFNLVNHYGFPATSTIPFHATVSEIGSQMLNTLQYGYLLPFEVVSMLLLAAMIGCIVISIKTPEQKKTEEINVTLREEITITTTGIIHPPFTEPTIIEEA